MDTAQPAIAAVSLGYLRVLRVLGLRPDAVAGHSFGELTALAAAGRFAESELLVIAHKRGELMAEAADSRSGAMLAVSTDVETVGELLAEGPSVVVADERPRGIVGQREVPVLVLEDAGQPLIGPKHVARVGRAVLEVDPDHAPVLAAHRELEVEEEVLHPLVLGRRLELEPRRSLDRRTGGALSRLTRGHREGRTEGHARDLLDALLGQLVGDR